MPKLLFIRYKEPWNILEGGEIVCHRNLDALEQVLGKENVDVVYVHGLDKRQSRISGAFNMLWDYFYGLTPDKVVSLVAKAMGYDYVWIDRSVFGILARRLRLAGYKGRIITFFHNIETIYFEAKLPKWLPGRGVVLRCARHNDADCCKYADTVVTLNERDSRILSGLFGRGADFQAPVMFRDRYSGQDHPSDNVPSKPLCMFLGSYFPANVEGIEWFVREVYGKVDIDMAIVGKGMDRIRETGKDWLLPGIEVIPDVPDLDPYLVRADIMVFPVFKGSGMKVKTCESLMFGKNIVATDEAWEGYELDCGRAGARCNDAGDFIRAIKGLAGAPRFNRYSREVFMEKYSDALAPGLFRKILG